MYIPGTLFSSFFVQGLYKNYKSRVPTFRWFHVKLSHAVQHFKEGRNLETFVQKKLERKCIYYW